MRLVCDNPSVYQSHTQPVGGVAPDEGSMSRMQGKVVISNISYPCILGLSFAKAFNSQRSVALVDWGYNFFP